MRLMHSFISSRQLLPACRQAGIQLSYETIFLVDSLQSQWVVDNRLLTADLSGFQGAKIECFFQSEPNQVDTLVVAFDERFRRWVGSPSGLSLHASGMLWDQVLRPPTLPKEYVQKITTTMSCKIICPKQYHL